MLGLIFLVSGFAHRFASDFFGRKFAVESEYFEIFKATGKLPSGTSLAQGVVEPTKTDDENISELEADMLATGLTGDAAQEGSKQKLSN